MRLTEIDRWLPKVLVGDSPDVRRRARLVVFAVGVALLVDSLVASLMPVVSWPGNPTLIGIAHVTLHLSTLLVLRWTGSVTFAAQYYIAVVFLQSALQIAPSRGLSAFGLIAVPIAAANLAGIRATLTWTASSVAAALAIPWYAGVESSVLQVCIATATLTLAVGIASTIVESSRARAVREMRSAEEGMRLQRERLRAFVEQTFPCIAELHDERLVFVSERVKDLLGLSPEEVVTSYYDLIRKEDVESLRRRLAEKPPARCRAELRARHRDGRWLWLEVFALPFGETPAERRWLFAARDVDGEVRDRERLEQAQRLDGVGALAAGIAHDFNNLLTVITGFGEQLPPSEPREQILEAAASASELTAQLLAFGRSGPAADALIDPVRELRALTPMIRSLLGEEIQLTVAGDAGGATSRIAPGRLEQVVLNLVTNAKEAMPAGGRLEISLAHERIEGERAAALGLSAGPFVRIEIRDTGRGMSEEVRSRAFDPFFSTKPAQRGCGLGLASAYGIARRCHGTLELETKEGAGTVARVFLPDAEEALPAAPPPPGAERPANVRPEAIWIVEDDPQIRRLMRTALETAGYRTSVAADGVAALALLDEQPPPRVLISDVIMPRMRGPELAARLRERQPELRVLFTSGYSEGEIGDQHSGAAGVRFLAKPFRPAQLVTAVAELTVDLPGT